MKTLRIDAFSILYVSFHFWKNWQTVCWRPLEGQCPLRTILNIQLLLFSPKIHYLQRDSQRRRLLSHRPFPAKWSKCPLHVNGRMLSWDRSVRRQAIRRLCESRCNWFINFKWSWPSSGGCPGGLRLRQVSRRGVCPVGLREGVCVYVQGVFTFPLWTEFLTHACGNITFPQPLLRTVNMFSTRPILSSISCILFCTCSLHRGQNIPNRKTMAAGGSR